MALQKSVGIYEAPAVAGDRAQLGNSVVNTPLNYLVGEGGVTVGGFCWESSTATDPMTIVCSGSGAPLGFVERILDNVNYDLKSEGTAEIAQGGRVTVAVKGDFYAEADTTVAVGATVYANATTGAVSFSSGEETTWKAVTAGEAGDLVIISNWA